MNRYDITQISNLERHIQKSGFEILKETTKDALLRVKILFNNKQISEVIGTLVEYYVYLRGFVDGLRTQKLAR